MAIARWHELQASVPNTRLIISGKRGIGGFRYRGIKPDETYTNFEDKTSFEEVEVLANQFLNQYITGSLDRLEVVYTKFESISRDNIP